MLSRLPHKDRLTMSRTTRLQAMTGAPWLPNIMCTIFHAANVSRLDRTKLWFAAMPVLSFGSRIKQHMLH